MAGAGRPPNLPSAPPLAAFSAEAYGNKTANLATLARLAGTGSTVPDFVGISDQDVRAFLQPGCTAALAALTAQLQRDHAAGARALTPAAKEALAAVRRAIAEVFSASSPHANAPSLAPDVASGKTPAATHALDATVRLPGGAVLQAFLQRHHNDALMVRSTGHEDSDVVANAGGNQSVVNVAARPEALRAAMQTVLTSYFSEKSYAQRLLAGDVVSKPAFVPLLVQKMVGERRDTAVPSSGVLFTQEMEGPTPGVAQIQSAFGHNDAVVANLLPVDTFYVDPTAVRKVIRRKPTRLSPAAAGGLKTQANGATLRMRPAISDAVARRLYDVGRTISQHFGQQMDIEWTYEPQTDTIYLLQARPLLAPAAAAPSHLVPAAVADLPAFASEVVGAGGGHVRTILSADALVVATDLPAALSAFLARPAVSEGSAPTRGAAAIVVQGAAEATSHEATTFRGVGLPVLRVDDLLAFSSFVAKATPLLLDTSTGRWVAASTLLTDGEVHAGVVAAGWGKHPLPPRLSTTATSAPTATPSTIATTAISAPVATATDSGAAAQTSAPALASMQNDTRLRGLVAQLCDSLGLPRSALPAADAAALWTLLGRREVTQHTGTVQELLAQLSKPQEPAIWATLAAALLRRSLAPLLRIGTEPALRERAHALGQQLVGQVADLAAVAARGPDDVTYLFHHNFLTAALLQAPDAAIVGGDALPGLLAEHAELQQLRASAPDRPLNDEMRASLASVAARLRRHALHDVTAQAWQRFAGHLTATPSGSQLLAGLVVALQERQLTLLWLNVVFGRAASAAAASPAAARAAAQAWRTAVEQPPGALGPWLAGMQSLAQQLAAGAGAFADPSTAAGAVDRLTAALATQVAEEGPRALQGADTLGKLQALATFRRVVDATDLAIKRLTGSPVLAAVDKVRLFARVVESFAGLTRPWLLAACPKFAATVPFVISTEQRLVDYEGELAGALHRLRYSKLTEATAMRELHFSPGFNVAAAQLASGADFGQNQPQSLEDFFSCAHQNLLQVVAAANTETGLDAAILPASLQPFVAALHRPQTGTQSFLDGRNFKPQLVHIELAPTQTSLRFNVPMREHSMVVEVTQPLTADAPILMHVRNFSAYDENYRDRRAGLAIALLAQLPGLALAGEQKPVRNEALRQTEWTWALRAADGQAHQRVTQCTECLRYVVQTSFNEIGEDVALSGLLAKLTLHAPEIEDALPRLSGAFFRDYPWYNHDFLTYFVQQGWTDTPGFRNLTAAIDAAPAQQDWLWINHSDHDRPLGRAPKAHHLLQAWRGLGGMRPSLTELLAEAERMQQQEAARLRAPRRQPAVAGVAGLGEDAASPKLTPPPSPGALAPGDLSFDEVFADAGNHAGDDRVSLSSDMATTDANTDVRRVQATDGEMQVPSRALQPPSLLTSYGKIGAITEVTRLSALWRDQSLAVGCRLGAAMGLR